MRYLIMACVLGLVWVTAAQTEPVNPISVPPDPSPVIFAALTTSNPSPQLGEPFTLTLTVRTPPNLPIVEWPSLSDLKAPFEALREEPRTLSQRATEHVYTQTADVVLWATGMHMTPELRVIYERGGRRFFAPVQSVSLFVPAQISNPLEASPRPSLSVFDLALPIQWGVATVGVVVFVVVLLVLRRRQPSDPTATERSRSAQVIIAQIEDLQSSGLSAEEIILVCVERLRAFLAEAVNIHAQEMTTSEIIHQLRAQRLMPKRLINALNTLLEQADLIKFANLSPEINPQQFIKVSIRWIKQTDQVISGLYD
ncbi:hypothetical protein VZO05_05325 [Aggregatilineales bacterium SYSU G02658]